MGTWTGDTGGGGTAFGPLTWNTRWPASTATLYAMPREVDPDPIEYPQLAAGPGTYTTIKVVAAIPLSVTDSITFTVRVNGADTGLTVTLPAGGSSATGSGSVAVVAGDRVSLKVVQSGTESVSGAIGVGVY